jgi:hypothetical protein
MMVIHSYNKHIRHRQFSCADYTIINSGGIGMDPKIEALIDRMEQARLRLNAAIDHIPPQTEVCPSWQVKQVLDHITGWDELVTTTLRLYQQGESAEVTIKSIDRFNAGSVIARRDLSLDQSRQAYDAARQEVLEILRNLPPEVTSREYKAPWGGKATIAGIIKIFVVHEWEHAEKIEKILAGKT